MQPSKDNLFTCFREDHKILGSGFHQLSACLRTGDTVEACALAQHLDAVAGSHIAFEETEFYPRLVPFFGRDAAGRMRDEHRQGLSVIRTLVNRPVDEPLDRDTCDRLLEQSETMETHIADCAELFEAIGRIPAEEQRVLHEKLLAWRQRRPKWTGFAAERRSNPV
ncbi:hemerythrin domain-containing protein [Candidatus Entotheonella palauensis]|uniref:Hemerythrin-like domain-containing protein n=1 Tax=Candidatus Entotheonella gemina TaxID=1429439 RepID=W4M2W8_9BACT|nr:hemerythrin domain-containing protein [Candidatus Entotheonella palauensis]ETX04545.1 MAG: hypothetical protein ETSY2_28195 [Candidatus Entotheonella gemina]